MSEMIREFTCISCPMGCALSVTIGDGEVIEVSGNTCKRGEAYARQEALHPVRVVTSLVDVAGCEMPVSCKTVEPIPKGLIARCLETLRAVTLKAPVRRGDVIVEDVCGTGVAVVATKDVLG